MRRLFTQLNARQNKGSARFAKAFIFLLFVFGQSVSLFAHKVDNFTSCGYVCAGSTVTVNAKVSATNSSTNYNWQFRDNSNTWKCFVNGSNRINGVNFTVSGATAKGQLSAAPTLKISNATTALNSVDVRVVMADGNNVSPCASNPKYTIWGTDKTLELKVLSGSDCSDINIYCSGGTPGTLKLGNLIWNDIDANGLKGANEPGVANATVKLYKDANNDNVADNNTVVATTTTNSSGIYSFTKLSPGNYIVGVVIPTGYVRGPASSIDPDNNVDNDNNGVTLVGANQAGGEVRSKAITLTNSGEPTNDGDDNNGNQTLDIPLCGNSQLGDLVWNDKNANGIQEAGEPGIGGATVKLTFPDGTTSTTTTNSNGKYLFTSLAPGNYKVTFTNPSGYVNVSPSNVGNNDAIDSDPVNGVVNVTVNPNSSNLTIDAGFYVKVVISNLSLGNQVWNDYDGDGKRDPNEPGIPGATVSLYTDNNSDDLPDGAAIKTAVTDALGQYVFTNLTEGRYIASLPILPGYQQTPNNTTQATSPYPDNNRDNDNNLVRLVGPNGPGGILYTNAITLSAGDEPTDDGDGANGNNTFDLAECGNAFIGDFVWKDINNNGIQDAGEPGINDVEVTITFSDGRTATTSTHTYTAENNPNSPVFDGYYNFPNLGPGTYKIAFTTPAGFTASPANQGGNDAKDSDPVNGAPVTVTLTANQSNLTIDAGFFDKVYVSNLTLGNQVWNDYDGDGKRDLNEPGIPGATVSLYTDNDSDNLPDGAAIKTTTTDALGQYLFTNLTEGRYIVSMPILPGYQQTPNTSTQDTSPFPDNNRDDDNNLVRLAGPNGPGGILYTNAITLNASDEPTDDGDDANGNNTLDLAQCGNAFIGDFVWNDLNANGIQDAGEPGINNVEVTITFSDGRTATTLTHTYDADNNPNQPIVDGYYNFPNMGPGTYKITFATPAGFYASPANAGSNDAKDSDPVNGAPVTVTLAANQSDLTIDAGFTTAIPQAPCPKLSLGNLVFLDSNGNGVKDRDEPGIGGLTVKLYADNDGNNQPDGDAISILETAEDGTYYFGNLAEGNYIVGVTTGTAYVQGPNGKANPNDNKDNDNNGIRTVKGEVFSNAITLSPGDEPINDGSDNNSNLTLDFGFKTGTPPCIDHCDCKNDCDHQNCGHKNCGHDKCKNDCDHDKCGHKNCGHNDCKNDCDHDKCGHKNCGHDKCKNDCDHDKCGHKNCGHNDCKNDCDHDKCGHKNCGHDKCKNDCDHDKCGHKNCGHDKCKNDCDHDKCGHKNCGHNSCRNNCDHNRCDHKTCGRYGRFGRGVGDEPTTAPTTQSVQPTAAALSAKLIAAKEPTKTNISVFPNPTGNYFVLKVNAQKEGKAVVRVLDAAGKTVMLKNTSVSIGTNSMTFNDISNFKGGLYTVQLVLGNEVLNNSLVVAK